MISTAASFLEDDVVVPRPADAPRKAKLMLTGARKTLVNGYYQIEDPKAKEQLRYVKISKAGVIVRSRDFPVTMVWNAWNNCWVVGPANNMVCIQQARVLGR